LGGLSDADWRDVLLRSIHEPIIEAVPFPRFPDVDFQTRIHGTANEVAVDEAFRFFSFVKGQVGEHHLRPSARFLDFGSGWGRMLRPYMRHYDLANIYAFEPTRLFLTVARTLNPHVNFLGGEFLPNGRIPRHMFDLIVGYSIFSHLSPNSTAVWLREMAELLNPGGFAVFTTWGQRFVDQLIAERKRLDAGQEIHWYYQFVLQHIGDPNQLRDHYASGKFIWIKSGDVLPNYGETLLSRPALERILREQGLPLEIVAFDTESLAQDAFVLRRC
jgi:SAM-dependent methyltransferase